MTQREQPKERRSSRSTCKSRAVNRAYCGWQRSLQRFPQRPVWALFMFVNGFVTIALLAAVAMLTNTATLFPSLGPTAFLFFFTPTAPTASPPMPLCGHAIGILCGYGSLVLFGLHDSPPTNVMGVDMARVLCRTVAGGDGGAHDPLQCGHPPAGATTLIVSLGIIRQPGAAGRRDRRYLADIASSRPQPAGGDRLSVVGQARSADAMTGY